VETTFAEILERCAWRPIPGCPGRFVAADGPSDASPESIAGTPPVLRRRVDGARDEVVVTPLASGGLISYRKCDERYLHTLGDADGFARKLAQLGIVLPG
jgi:hypothetical protein